MRSIYLIVNLMLIGAYSFAQNGTIRGTIYDGETGETMIGATVLLEGTTKATATDLNGKYSLNDVPPGTYTLIVKFISYAPQNITGVEVKEKEVSIINTTLKVMGSDEGGVDLQAITVEAKMIQNTENSMLALQKKADAVQDAISSQEISRSGSSNAAESIKQMTGTSIVDGKQIVVRGLSDRYSTAQLNGVTMANTDPYRNSAQMDLIPANLLENIVATKTFTPDQSGNFTGGNVNLSTKSMPEKFTLNYSSKMAYNSQSSFNDEFITYQGGKNDKWGYDDGSRALPEIFSSPENRKLLRSPLTPIYARSQEDLAYLLDDATKSLNSQMEPGTKTSFTDYSNSFSVGNQFNVLNRPLGIILGVSQGKSYAYYGDGISSSWTLTGSDAAALNNFYNLKDQSSVENPRVNGLAGLSYQVHKNHEIGANFIYTHDAEIMTRYQTGMAPGFISGSDKKFETRTLSFKERGLTTTQLKGKHAIDKLNKMEIAWIGGYTKSFQYEPDLRFFANENVGDSLYYISISEYSLPAHYWRYLNDSAMEGKIDFTIPLSKKANNKNKLKFGFLANNKGRDFEEYRINMKRGSKGAFYAGDNDAYFGEENTGILDTTSNGKYNIGVHAVDDSNPANNYTGSEEVYAFYGMGIIDVTKSLKFIGGARVERTVMNVQSGDSTLKAGNIDTVNILPSVNLVYKLNEKMNLRAAYTQTLARPNMREMAPFVSFDFIGGFQYVGNPNLKMTNIRNYDLRWEWFTKPGEVIAVSAYYKDFKNPIIKEFNMKAVNPEISFQNREDAEVYGFEVDFRKGLDSLDNFMKNFRFGINASYIYSRVQLNPQEYEQNKQYNSELKAYRPFQGQSPYLLNTNISYSLDSLGLDINLSYNLFGPRLSEIGMIGLPDVYEKQAKGMLNLNVSKDFGKHFRVRFGARNLLNVDYNKIQTFKGEEYITQSYTMGRTFSLGLTYFID